ncbi:MAG: sulfotransferase family 2 domain-containing protein [Pseudomonadota bacterium]
MIYLQDPGLIFLKPHKVAGSSFEIALSCFARPGDIVTTLRDDEPKRRAAGGTGPQGHRYPVRELGEVTRLEWMRARRRKGWPHKFFPHMSASLTRERLGPDRYDRAIKVSIVRNPYERIVSTYYWRQHLLGKEIGFERWCLEFASEIDRDNKVYLTDGKVAIDRFLRFENLGSDIAALEADYPALAGVGDAFSRTDAKTGVRPRQATFAALSAGQPALRKLVEKRCRFEIERFGYTPE